MHPASDRSDNLVAIIQARMSSQRLPGKVLMELAGEPVLGHIVRRAKTINSVSAIVVATTEDPRDNPIVAFAEEEKIGVFRGSELDVLGRVFSAGEAFGADAVFELTGDNPILDCEIANQLISRFQTNKFDLVTNNLTRTFPMGIDMSVISMSTLSRVAQTATDDPDREHVLRFIHERPDHYSVDNLEAPREFFWPSLALTLDEADDFALLSAIFDHFFHDDPFFGLAKVVAYLRSRPDLVRINQKVQRRFLL